MSIIRNQLLLAAGGDVWSKYGVLVRRTQLASPFLGESAKETVTRAGAGGTSIWTPAAAGVELVPAAANTARPELVVDPVTGLLQTYLVSEGARTNILDNGSYESDANGLVANNSATVTRDNTHALGGSWAAKIVTANSGGSGAGFLLRSSSRMAVVAGTAYTFSAWVYVPAASVGKQMSVELAWYSSAPAYLSSSISSAFTLLAVTGGWQRLTFTATAVASAVTVEAFLYATSAQGVFTVWADLVQFETGSFATSAIPTSTATVTRAADVITIPWGVGCGPLWAYLRFLERGTIADGNGYSFLLGTAGQAPQVRVAPLGGFYSAAHAGASGAGGIVSSAVAAAPTYGQLVELLVLLFSDGSIQLRQSINGAAETVGAQSAANAFGTTWKGSILQLAPSAAPNFQALSRLLVGLGPGTAISTIADARAVAV